MHWGIEGVNITQTHRVLGLRSTCSGFSSQLNGSIAFGDVAGKSMLERARDRVPRFGCCKFILTVLFESSPFENDSVTVDKH